MPGRLEPQSVRMGFVAAAEPNRKGPSKSDFVADRWIYVLTTARLKSENPLVHGRMSNMIVII